MIAGIAITALEKVAKAPRRQLWTAGKGGFGFCRLGDFREMFGKGPQIRFRMIHGGEHKSGGSDVTRTAGSLSYSFQKLCRRFLAHRLSEIFLLMSELGAQNMDTRI